MTYKKKKMNAKNVLVSFLVIASVLFLASTVSALTPITTDVNSVRINDVRVVKDGVVNSNVVGVTSGDTLNIEVQFTVNGISVEDGRDVKIKAELEGQDIDVTAVSDTFVVIDGTTYTKTFSIKVPADLKDQLSDNLSLSLKIYNSNFKEEVNDITLTLQRPSYDVAIKSVMTSNTVEAGQLLPVDIVLKNVGYNDLSDLYVTVKMSDLGIEKTAYFGDLVNLKPENSDDNSDKNTVTGRIYLEIPYNAKSGTYTLEVKAENDDTSSVASQDVKVNNGFSSLAMRSGSNTLTVLNPTTQLKVYEVKYADKDISVIVPAASSKDVTIETPATGDYNFDVSVLSGDQLLSTVNFSGTAQTTTQLTSPVLVLTVILAVVFLVLLVVLIVLITKRPQKTEEFGESYY